MKNNCLMLLVALLVHLSSQAQQTADALIGQVIKLPPRSVPKYDPRPKPHVVYLQTAFNDAVYQQPKALQDLKDKVILKVELIYTTYRKSETFDQHALNRKRLRSLFSSVPQLLTQPSVEWVLFAQTGCTSAEEGKDYFHGVAITYREPETDALRDTELAFLYAVAEGSVPASAYDAYIKHELKPEADTTGAAAAAVPPKIKMPEFVAGERARIDYFTNNLHYPKTVSRGTSEEVLVQFVVDKEGKIQHISLLGGGSPTPYHEEVLRFMRAMPEWRPGTVNGKRTDCMVQMKIDFTDWGSIVPSPLEVYAMDANIPAPKFDYSRIQPTPQGKFVSATLQKNGWKHAAIVCDVTGSMAPYSAQVLEFLQNQFKTKDTSIVRFLFFNDGNNRKDHTKKVGTVGGIYSIQTASFDELIAKMAEAMKAGTGGDLEENDVEALLKAEADCPACQSTILIADNMASPRDMALAAQLKKPVHVIVCGFSPVLNADYMNLARATKGTLHFNNRDYTNLHTFEEGSTFQVGKEVFVVKDGRFVRKES